MRSEKVYDVIGRVFEGKSISDYMRRSLEGEEMEQLSLGLGGQLTAQQVAASAERERQLFGGGGDMAKRLGTLPEKCKDRSDCITHIKTETHGLHSNG